MCGIFAYLFRGEGKLSLNQIHKIINNAVKTQHRGPDKTEFETYDGEVCFCFHRLAIVGKTKRGNQPLSLDDDPTKVLICNGEIYNYKELAKLHGLN